MARDYWLRPTGKATSNAYTEGEKVRVRYPSGVRVWVTSLVAEVAFSRGEAVPATPQKESGKKR